MLTKKKILGVSVTDAQHREVLEYVLNSVEKKGEPYYIVTPNPEIVMRAKTDSSLKIALDEARISLCDGVGLQWASKLLGSPIRDRITGTDFMIDVCKDSVRLSKKGVRKPVTVGFLGGKAGVAEKAAECLLKQYPGLAISFIASEWTDAGFINAQKLMASSSQAQDGSYAPAPDNNKKIDILFVAFGFPKQEVWMHEQLGKIPVMVMMGVGGAFDYVSGGVSRAPLILRNLGLEWLYRLVRQPWRLRRQLALIKFIGLVLRERFAR